MMFVLSSIVWSLALAALGDAQLLGSAAAYGVFAASTVTNTGNTAINGNIGLAPGSSITGFPPGTFTGSRDISNGPANTAKGDIQTAYDTLAGMPADTDLTGQDLGGLTLQSGVYKFSSSGGLTGSLTLDAGGNPDALFVFQFGSTLTTASASSVVLIGGAQACNVYWQVGSSATLGTGTDFIGNILALASITATTGVSNDGGLYALTAAVTLDTNIINAQRNCNGVIASPSTTPIASTTLATSTTPAPILDVTVTLTLTVTITNPASTTTVTKTGAAAATVTVTKTVSNKVATRTSTKYYTTTRVKTTTAPTPKCTSTKRHQWGHYEKRGNSKKTKTKTETTYCAGHTTTKRKSSGSITHTVSSYYTATPTKWSTLTYTKTSTSTYTPKCTSVKGGYRPYARMFA